MIVTCPTCEHSFDATVDPRHLKIEAIHAVEHALANLRQARRALLRAGLAPAGHSLDELIDALKAAIHLFAGL